MFFLAQIHCPDLKGLPGAELLPETGLLSFFGDFRRSSLRQEQSRASSYAHASIFPIQGVRQRKPCRSRRRSGRGTPRFILALMDTAYRRKRVHIASTTSFSGGRAWFRTICPWGWRPEIARFGFSCNLTVISALADQSTS